MPGEAQTIRADASETGQKPLKTMSAEFSVFAIDELKPPSPKVEQATSHLHP
jgi:hypothetical protein